MQMHKLAVFAMASFWPPPHQSPIHRIRLVLLSFTPLVISANIGVFNTTVGYLKKTLSSVLNGKGNKEAHFVLFCFWFVILSMFVTMFKEDKGGVLSRRKEVFGYLLLAHLLTGSFLPALAFSSSCHCLASLLPFLCVCKHVTGRN